MSDSTNETDKVPAPKAPKVPADLSAVLKQAERDEAKLAELRQPMTDGASSFVRVDH